MDTGSGADFVIPLANLLSKLSSYSMIDPSPVFQARAIAAVSHNLIDRNSMSRVAAREAGPALPAAGRCIRISCLGAVSRDCLERRPRLHPRTWNLFFFLLYIRRPRKMAASRATTIPITIPAVAPLVSSS
jgi:hypothetical protein